MQTLFGVVRTIFNDELQYHHEIHNVGTGHANRHAHITHDENEVVTQIENR